MCYLLICIFRLGSENWSSISREKQHGTTKFQSSFITFDPIKENHQSYDARIAVANQSIDQSDLDINGFIKNVIRLFQERRKRDKLKNIFREWSKIYYESSIKLKAIEIQVKKKHNYSLVHLIFNKWRDKALTNLNASNIPDVQKEITPTSFSNPFTWESRITKYEDIRWFNQQDSGSLMNENIFHHPFIRQEFYSSYLNNSNEMRLPYKSNIETTESIEFPYKKVDQTQESYNPNFNAPRPSVSSSDIHSYDLPFQSIRVTNHLKKWTVQDTLQDDQGGNKMQFNWSSVQESVKATLSQNFESITPIERIHVLRKIFLKWWILVQNNKINRIKEKFSSLYNSYSDSERSKPVDQVKTEQLWNVSVSEILKIYLG